MSHLGTVARSLREICLPHKSDYADIGRTWRADLVAGLTVGIVALPLALAFGVTSGLGAAAGLITAVIAGAVAAIFGGSRFQVSGPTGAMTVVLVPIISQYGTGAVLAVAVLAGLIVIVMALSRLGRLVAYIPWPVVEGFTLGIAAIIFLQQIPAALNTTAAEGDNTARRALDTALQADWAAAMPTLAIVALVIVVMVISPRIHRSIPGSLVAVILATILVGVGHFDVQLIGELPRSLPAPTLPSTGIANLSVLIGPALAVAVLCAIESLLSARVADRLAKSKDHQRVWHPDRELFGQGLATVASGIFGGMPATGAIARTAVNVRAGAQSRLAAIIHSAVLLAIIYFAAPAVSQIPLASLAGVLIVTSFRMVERHAARAVLTSGKSEAAIFIITAACTVAFDLIIAIEVGLGLAIVLALKQIADRSSAKVELCQPGIASIQIDGSLFFAASPRIFQGLEIDPTISIVILRVRNVHVIDASGAAALTTLVNDLRERGHKVLLKGPQAQHRQKLVAAGVIAAVERPYPEESERRSHIFADFTDAISFAEKQLSPH